MTAKVAKLPWADESCPTMAALKELQRQSRLGIVFVPDLVRELESRGVTRQAAHACLLRRAARGEVELRPESGLGRLSAEEQRQCLIGPSGKVISYVRTR